MYLLFHELKYKSSNLFHIDSFLRLFIHILLLRLESTYEIGRQNKYLYLDNL